MDEHQQPPMPPQDIYNEPRLPMMPMQEQSDSAIIYQLDAEQICIEIEHSLLGEKFDEESGKWLLPKGAKSVMCKEGIDYIMCEVRRRVNRNTFLSFLTPKDIDIICSDLHKTITDVLILKWQDWKIEKPMIKPTVYGVMDTIYIALKRSVDKTTLDYLKKATQVVEQIRRGENEQNHKKFGIF